MAAQTGGLGITGVTTNATVGKYEKLEITFNIENSVAANRYMPFAQSYPAGLTAEDRNGISVDAQFLPPGQSDWQNARSQPAFYYQNFLAETRDGGGRDWLYPTGSGVWKVRYAPNEVGPWRYRLVAVDASGSVTTEPGEFTVTESSARGFVRVAQGDRRYFEFDNGEYFSALGYNMNFNHVSWVSPVAANRQTFQAMGQNGVQLVRMWLSQWSIFGAGWNPWKGLSSQGGDPPASLLSSNVGEFADSNHELALVVGDATDRCVFHDPYNNAPIAVKRGTTYQIRIYYYPNNLVGSGGFAAKLGDYNGCATATAITPYVRQGASESWQWLTGTFTTSQNQDYLDHLFLHMENMTGGSVRIAEVEIREMTNGNPVGANILQKPKMDFHRYFDQRNSFGFDRVVELAAENGVYLRPVIGDHREWTFTHIDHNGNPTSDGSGSGFYFYGPTDTTMNKTRWLQKAWWRYLQARWGYSPNIHSWEYVNEGDPGYAGHRISANMMGEYFKQFTPHQMVATSVWTGSTSNWNLRNYPGLDFADVHQYIQRSNAPEQFFDAAEAMIRTSTQWGGTSAERWPVVWGETGLVTNQNLTADPDVRRDTQGVWLHNFLWAGLNSGSLISSYWYENMHIYDCPVPGSVAGCRMSFDGRRHFRLLADFLVGIELNKGGYQDAGLTGFDTNIIRAVGQKNISLGKAHVWIQNKKHTWCAVVGGVSGCTQTWDGGRLAGEVRIGGFAANQTLPVEYWYFDQGSNLISKENRQIATDGLGQMIINLGAAGANVVDMGVKIGNYGVVATPTPTGSAVAGDANGDGRVDGMDYVVWLTNYGGTGTGGDFNSDSRVDGLDYVIWLNNYGA